MEEEFLGDDVGRSQRGRGGVQFGGCSGRTGQGGSVREGLAECPGGVGGSHRAGARMDPCQQCNYSSF